MTTTTNEPTAPVSAAVTEEPPVAARDTSAPVPRGVTIAIAITLAAMVLVRLSGYGIWDPWELTVADAARKLGEGTAVQTTATLSLRLVQGSFALFGSREWAGRLPMALCGVALLATLWLWVRRYSGARAGLYAALVLGTTPMFLLHSREMVGATPSFLAATLVAVGASNALFAGLSSEPTRSVWLWLGLCALASLIGIYTQGALLVVLPALGSVAVAALLLGTPFDQNVARERRSAAWIVIGAATLLGLVIARAVARHGAEYSVWTGGTPLDEAVPTFERIISHLFHGLAPWSAAAPVALGSLLWTTSEGTAARTDAPLRVLCVIWGALAYAAATIYLSSFGTAAFPAPAAIAIAVALWVSELEERKGSYWPELVITVLMVGLLIRDYALYPASPIDGLELSATLPDKFNPKGGWAGVFGAFAVALVISCMATSERAELDFKAPYRGLRTLWDRSTGHRAWLVVFALLWLGLVLYGAISVFTPPGVRLTSIARRVGRVAGAVALFAPFGLALLQGAFHYSSKLANRRNLPLVITALVCGVYASQVFLPKLSAHLSPREVFDLFEQLAGPKEPLAQHQVHGRAAAYYVNREVKDIDAEHELVNFLAQPGRHWALLPSERLADVDVAFRRRTGRHLFLPTAENARVSLVASEPVAGKNDANPLSSSVLKTPPKVDHPLNVNFEGKIELIGYNLELPQKDYVGAGQTFVVTWVFRALQGNLGAYQAFLHVDAEGQRINGDHEPVDGMYPVRLWTQGDIVVDRQKVSVPATNPPGKYTLYFGFFRGESRLKVLTGPKDDADRVIAGTIQIR